MAVSSEFLAFCRDLAMFWWAILGTSSLRVALFRAPTSTSSEVTTVLRE
jgi:hypothetical protein